ncbi:MAG: citrate lyase ACP, partial [Planctomycetes bacterium]|nr:citrate lyase ACP [Planctomycetota bacterium]
MSNPKTAIAHSAEAGRRGSDVRSDCWVRMEPKGGGGIDLNLKSKVESMYGDATRSLVREVLAGLGVENARVEIEDGGALPFVIAARVEAAARRLGLDVGEGYTLDFADGTQYGTQRDRFRRSRLYLPGNESKFMLNAGLHKPDAVILDLEDSVAPPEKDAARILVRNALRAINFYGAERMVRINQGDRGLEDLEFIVPHNVHLILIPKVESAEQVRQVDERIGEILSRAAGTGDPDDVGSPRGAPAQNPSQNGIFLMPIIESALGAIRSYEIATASDNIVALAIGLEDYTADIGTQRTPEGRESFWARSQVVNAARAAGIQPIDTVFSDVADLDG